MQSGDGTALIAWIEAEEALWYARYRKAAGVSFQFRDIRAKSATDSEDLQYAQKLLGHKHQTMTQHYTQNRKGERMRRLK